MLSCHLGEGRTLVMEGAGGKCYELHFSSKGEPVAFRIKVLVDHLGYDYIIHRRSGARLPKGWGGNSLKHDHDARAFSNKLISFMHIAAAS